MAFSCTIVPVFFLLLFKFMEWRVLHHLLVGFSIFLEFSANFRFIIDESEVPKSQQMSVLDCPFFAIKKLTLVPFPFPFFVHFCHFQGKSI